jgi:hypothetical protein
LHCSALIGQAPDAAQPADLFAEAVVAVAFDLVPHEACAAVAVVDLVPHELAVADADFAPSQAKTAEAHQAVAAMARARSRNGFMSNLPEGGARPVWSRETTPEASACVRGSVLAAHVAGVSEVQKLPAGAAASRLGVRR